MHLIYGLMLLVDCSNLVQLLRVLIISLSDEA